MKITPVNNNQNFGKVIIKKKPQTKPKERPSYDKMTTQQALQHISNFKDKNVDRVGLDDRFMFFSAKTHFSKETEKLYNSAIELAKISRSQNLESWHLHLASLIKLNDYLSQVLSGEVDPIEETIYATAVTFPNVLFNGCDLWTKPELIKGAAEIVSKQIDYMMNAYVKPSQKNNPKQRLTTPTPSAAMMQDVVKTHKDLGVQLRTKDFPENYLFALPTFSQDKKLKNDYMDFIRSLQSLGMTSKPDTKDKHHIEFYDKKADAIWKNIAHGNNVLVLSNPDNQASVKYLEKSFVNLINKPGQKYGSIDPEKTNIILLNENAQFGFVEDMVRNIQMDKSKKGTTTVIMGNFFSLLKNCNAILDQTQIESMFGTQGDDKDKANIRFVFSISPETYHSNTQAGVPLAGLLSSYAQQTLPMLNAVDAKEYLANESGLEFIKTKIKKDISKETVYKAIEVTSSKSGNYPEKAIELLDAVAKFFVDSEEITPSQIDTYLKETESLSDVSDTEERSIIFDTGKTLSDIKGMPMTSAEANSIVRQIKNGTVGTRGFIIQHNHGSSYGGGRRHTAEAIAGETQIPMVVINAKDFALKDIDALSQEAGLSELKIKKLIQTAKAQAEANGLNTAMIFIENFDNFGSNPLWGISSIYEQKAFSQLLAEMDAARKDGKINLVVMGSTNMPQYLDENIQKPYKFLNQVVVYQPQNADQRREILDYYIEKNNYKIADEFEGQKEQILTNISESTQYFTVVDLMYLLDNANIISKERQKEAIDGSDFTESFLQISSGRTNTAEITDDSKKIVTSHEAGHALTLHLMYEIAQKQNISWHLPQKVDFITLDPRGSYGGAMFFKQSENDKYSFERVMSEIISDYGGHSAENIIYGMRGSWGISEDMRMAAWSAQTAVTVMGMGNKTGVRHTFDDEYITEKQKENIADDVEKLLKTGKKISDSIIEGYKDFILEFTQKHYSKVATGECIIPASQFVQELNDWRSKQTPEKLEELNSLEMQILNDLNECKQGK
ncbi:MAG: AAA family ATPase [Candidatus Gastranaerophilales bacterium]|nr:AAA family ATPase [Candidatus Gastranaerophilales bacterium]